MLDAGSGIAGLLETLGPEPTHVQILLTHCHWDHIEGLAKFVPLVRAGWAPHIWAPAFAPNERAPLDAFFGAFPSSTRTAGASFLPEMTLVEPGEFEVGSFHVRAVPLRHPGGALAYRITGRTGDLVYISDHEFGDPAIDEALPPFALNSGATVLDACFLPDELPSRAGWGHASWRQAVSFASATGAGQLWLFHHDPARTDAELVEIERSARRVYPATRVAREGDTFRI